MHGLEGVAIFWDYENCPVPSNTSAYSIVDNICSIARPYGSVRSFKAYLEISDQTQKSLALRSELQSSGVSLLDCPHNGRKDVADKMIIVDMFAHAIDTPAPSTVVLITGDRDFAYAVSILRLRQYRMVLVTLSNAHASLTAQASVCLDWNTHILAHTEASVKSSGHLKRGSSSSVQEKLRQLEMPNFASDWLEVRQNEEASFLQVVRDATKDRQAPQVYSNRTSTASPSKSGQRSKERSPDSTNSTSIPPLAKSNSELMPLGLTSVVKSAISTPIPAKETPLDDRTSSRNLSTHSIISNRKQSINTLDILDDKPTTSNHLDDHEESFIQPLLNQLVPLHPLSEAGSGSESSPTLFLPSILTGSSSRTRTFTTSKVSLESVQPSPAHSSDTQTTAYLNKPVTKVTSAPTLAPSIPRTNEPKPAVSWRFGNVENVLSPVVKETTNAFPSTPLQRLPDIVTPSPTATSNPSISATPMTRHASDDSRSPYPAPAVSTPLRQIDMSTSTNGKGLALLVPSTPLCDKVAPPLQPPPSVHLYPQPLPSSSPSSSDSPLPRIRSHGGESELAFNYSSQRLATAARSDSDGRGPVHGAKSESLPVKNSSPPSLPIFPSKVSETLPTLSSLPFTILDQSSAAAPPQPTSSVVPQIFRILVECLQVHLSQGNPRPLRGVVSLQMNDGGSSYTKAGVTNFGQYVALAEERGIIELGGTEAWISLKPQWHAASTSACADIVTGSPSPVVEKTTLSATQRNTVEFDQSSILCPSTPLQPLSVISGSRVFPAVLECTNGNSATDSAITTIDPIPINASLSIVAVEDSVVKDFNASAESARSLSTDIPSQPGTSSIPVISTSQTPEAFPSSSNSLLEDECTSDDSQPIIGIASAALPTPEPQLAHSAIKSTDSDVSRDPPSENLPPPDISVDFHPPTARSASNGLVTPSSPVNSASEIGESVPDASPVTPLPIESISLPNAVLQPQGSASPIISPSAPQIEEALSSSSATLSAVAKGASSSSPVSPAPAPVMQPRPASSLFPETFLVLVQCLQAHRSKGIERPLRSVVALEVHKNGSTYQKAGVERFAEYAALAMKRGIIELGGAEGAAWISLKPDWYNASVTQPVAPPAVPEIFKILVRCLQAHRSKGMYCPTRTAVSFQVNKNGTTYKKAGVTKFKHYIALAEKAGIVELGGEEGAAWMRLKSQWYDAVVS